MPSLGADMDAGTLAAWRVDVGQRVRRGDIVAEVETDKGIIAIESFHDTTPRMGIRFVGPRTIADLRAELGSEGTYTLLIRSKQPPSMEPKLAAQCLIDAGLVVEPINLGAAFTIDNGRVPVIAVRVRPATPVPESESDGTNKETRVER